MATLFPKDRRRIYEEERIRLEVQEEYKRQQGKKMAVFMSLGCLTLFLAVGGFFAMAYYVSKSEEIPVGSEVRLYSSSGKFGVPVDLDAFMEYRHALGADNKDTIMRLILSGRVVLVDSGTRAKTISDGPTIYKVSILDGKHAGRTGYLEDEWISYKRSK